MNCVVCAIAKQENLYIYEWAKHHLDIGFSHIHIYDNNDIDGELIQDVFTGTPIEHHITIHDVRGKTCMQLVVYQDCYDNEEFDWCAFIDIDEFITFVSPAVTIKEFLSDKQSFDGVHLNWLCYGDDEMLTSDGTPVRERIRHPIKPINFKSQYILIPDNAHIKSILKKGKKLIWDAPSQILNWATPHTPSNLINVCNESGISIPNSPWAKLNHNTCYVAHYITKTISEYGVKVQRRAADNNNYYHSYTRFFLYNKLTLGKLIMLKRISPSVKFLSILKDLIKNKLMLSQNVISQLSKKYKRNLKEEKAILEKIDL